jgi:hypothetical protein
LWNWKKIEAKIGTFHNPLRRRVLSSTPKVNCFCIKENCTYWQLFWCSDLKENKIWNKLKKQRYTFITDYRLWSKALPFSLDSILPIVTFRKRKKNKWNGNEYDIRSKFIVLKKTSAWNNGHSKGDFQKYLTHVMWGKYTLQTSKKQEKDLSRKKAKRK